MAKENLSITELKNQLKQLPPEEITKLLVESYKISDKVKLLLNATIKGDASIAGLIETLKKKIKNEILPEKGIGRFRVSVVKKAVSEFKVVCKDTRMILDLMLYVVEICVEHIAEYDDLFEDMVDYIDETYAKIVQIINKKNDLELFEYFKARLFAIVDDTKHAGCWGIHDSFAETYYELKWQEGYEDDDN
jgi:hypothetical protein